MPVEKLTLTQLKKELDCDEPDYTALRLQGVGVVPHLLKFLNGKDNLLAAKATSLAGMLSGSSAIAVLEAASKHKDVGVRCAAAHGATSMKLEDVEPLLIKLMSDRSTDVKVRALSAAESVPSIPLKNKVLSVANKTGNKHLKLHAKAVLKALQ